MSTGFARVTSTYAASDKTYGNRHCAVSSVVSLRVRTQTQFPHTHSSRRARARLKNRAVLCLRPARQTAPPRLVSPQPSRRGRLDNDMPGPRRAPGSSGHTTTRIARKQMQLTRTDRTYKTRRPTSTSKVQCTYRRQPPTAKSQQVPLLPLPTAQCSISAARSQ